MRRFGGWLLVVVGLILTVAGAAAAVLIGPDDAIDSGTEHIESPGAAIVTDRGLIEFAGPTLVLEVSSQSGPVFVGVGSEVDVADLVSDVSRTQIDQVDVGSGVETSLIRGSQDFLAVGPDLDWWLESDTSQQARVEFPLPDRPVSVLVMNADGASPVVVDVEAAVEIRGAFWGVVAVGLVGVGLLIFGLLMLRQGRRRRRADKAASPDTPDPNSSGPASADQPSAADSSSDRV